MIIATSKNRHGENVLVEKRGEFVIMRLGRSPDAQSFFPVPQGSYYQSVAEAPLKGSLLILGVAGASAGHVAHAAGFKRIEGMDADPELVKLGRDHFHADQVMDRTAIGDVYNFEHWKIAGWWDRAWDCIFFDAYNASKLSQKALENIYLRFLLSRINSGGVLLFNCPNPVCVDRLRGALTAAGLTASWHKYMSNWVATIKKV